MKFIETPLKDAFEVELEMQYDERGFFARCFCEQEFEKSGIYFKGRQTNISHNKMKGTLRGMHFQRPPYEEGKIVTCTKGAIYDVIVDMRKDSPSFLHWHAQELTESNGKMLYIPKGFAHGFLTLENNTNVFYYMSDFFVSGYAIGFYYNDPTIQIQWPFQPILISLKDQHLPLISALD